MRMPTTPVRYVGRHLVEPQRTEMSRDERGGLELPIPELRVLVDLVTHLDDLIDVPLDRGVDAGILCGGPDGRRNTKYDGGECAERTAHASTHSLRDCHSRAGAHRGKILTDLRAVIFPYTYHRGPLVEQASVHSNTLLS